MSFAESFDRLAAIAHRTAVDKGWWDNERNDGELIALMHSESIFVKFYSGSKVGWPAGELHVICLQTLENDNGIQINQFQREII